MPELEIEYRFICECECGCGNDAKLGNRFINGHAPSWNTGKGKLKSSPQLCDCGICGLMTNPGRRFIYGHNSKGKTKENDPGVRAISEKLKGRTKENDPSKKAMAEKLARLYIGANHHRFGKTKENDMSIKAQSEKMKGRTKDNNSGMKAMSEKRKGRTKENDTGIKAQSEKITGRTKENDSGYKIISEKLTGRTKEEYKYLQKHSENMKEKWQESEFVTKQMQARCVMPNKQEVKLSDILNELYPGEWKFVGDGQVIIAGKCPDFINVNGQKKIIELFGDYWHKGQDPQDRKDIFKEFGYDTLVIWERELKNHSELKFKIHKFMR